MNSMRNTEFENCHYEPVNIQELPLGDSPKRNCRGITISILIILGFCGIGATAFYILWPEKVAAYTGTPLSFREFFFGALHEPGARYMWLQEKLLAYEDASSGLTLLTIGENGEVKNNQLEEFVSNWILSNDASFVTYSVASEELYRHSTKATYAILVMENGMLKEGYPVTADKSSNVEQKLRLFKWNPSGHDFVFVYNTDIYYRPDPADPSESAIRITWNSDDSDVDDPDVISGVTDWLYEEEIFHTSDAMWWSTNGQYLAYATFNDTGVRRMVFDYYPDKGNDNYPRRVRIAYPKVGEQLPRVTLHVWKKGEENTIEIKPPVDVEKLNEFYLFSVSWPNITIRNEISPQTPVLLAVWSNRVQNMSYISLCNILTGTCILNYVVNRDPPSNSGIWVEPTDSRIEYADGNRYFAILPSLQEDGQYYKHVAGVEVKENGEFGRIDFLTSGTWEVIQIVGYDTVNSRIYFTAANPLPRRKNLFSVSTHPASSVTCLTCWMADSLHCTNVNVGFSKDGDHHVLTCDGSGVPFTILRKASTNQTIFSLTNSTQFKDFIRQKALPKVQYETIHLDEEYEAVVRILYPPGVNETNPSGEKYPLIQFVYAGPNSQYIWEQWYGAMMFETYLASNRRYIIISIDARGCSNRGTKYKRPIYRNLGGYEISDQISAVRILASKSNVIDQKRMAVWGWSYGGFVTVGMIEQGAFDLYKCAVAVAPVTDFRYYDAAYVERYMGLYTDPHGHESYTRTNLMSNVSQFANGKFMLIHGTADDNVHFQNSALLAKALTQLNIQFSYMVYTNGDHSLSSSRLHLYTTLDNYFRDCFTK